MCICPHFRTLLYTQYLRNNVLLTLRWPWVWNWGSSERRRFQFVMIWHRYNRIRRFGLGCEVRMDEVKEMVWAGAQVALMTRHVMWLRVFLTQWVSLASCERSVTRLCFITAHSALDSVSAPTVKLLRKFDPAFASSNARRIKVSWNWCVCLSVCLCTAFLDHSYKTRPSFSSR